MFPFNVLDYFSFGKARIKKEREKLIKELEPFRDRLVPIEAEDLELISFTISEKKTYRSSSGKGLFLSIYDEPMMAFAFNTFNHKKLQKLIMIETANHHILYMDKHKYTDCYFNNQLIGKITGNNLMYSPRKRLLGRVHNSPDAAYSSIIFKDKEIAVFNPIETDSKFNKRVFDIVKGKITKDEQLVLMTLGFYYLIHQLMNLED